MNEREVQERIKSRLPPERRTGEEPDPVAVPEHNVAIDLVSCPPWEQVERMLIDSSLASFGYSPHKYDKLSSDERQYMIDVLMDGAVLPNALEGVKYVFYVRNINKTILAQITRTRIGASFVSVTSGDFDQRQTPYIVPDAIEKAGWGEEFREHQQRCYELYARMVDGDGDGKDEVPLEQAREVMTTAVHNYHVLTINFRAIQTLWNKRRCEASQPPAWAYILDQIKGHIQEVHPPLGNSLTWSCEDCRYPYVLPWAYNQFACPRDDARPEASPGSGNFVYDDADARELRAPDSYDRHWEYDS